MSDTKPLEIAIPDPGQALKPLHKQAKFTRKKKLIVIEELGKVWNLARACQIAKIARSTVYSHIKNDEQFSEAYQLLKESLLDTIEQSSVLVALHPSREGYNDRKLLLQAHRDEYKVKPIEINTTITLNASNSIPIAQSILQKYNAINADYKELDESDNDD